MDISIMEIINSTASKAAKKTVAELKAAGALKDNTSIIHKEISKALRSYYQSGQKDKNLEELMALADELARGYFRQGLNCAECVLRTFMDIYECNMPDEVICMATGMRPAA